MASDQSSDSSDLLDYLTCGDIYPNVLGEVTVDHH